MFDIDGTLTESMKLDSATFVDALADVFGFNDVCDDWASYQHVTDAGILAEVFSQRCGRLPSPDEVARIKTHYVELLSVRVAAVGGIKPLGGADKILKHLLASPKHAVAYASGGWSVAARLKLRLAGLPAEQIPCAFSDDEASREGLCRLAHARSEAQHSRRFTHVVYVGDGVWDIRASRHLGYGFIGVGRGAAADRLRQEGAVHVLPDFQDDVKFCELLAQIEPLGR